MRYIQTTALKKILALRKRNRIIQGGSSAGKSIAIMLALIDNAQSSKNKLISVVSESFPHLKRGVIRDFLNIMESHNYYEDSKWNRTDYIYTFETGSKIEFFSADQPDKVRGPRRDILFENECNNIPYETHTQLAIRTNDYVFLDFNPVNEFWVHTEIMKPENDYDFLKLTYLDNEALPKSVVKELESRKSNEKWWRTYGLGELGEFEGRIYKDWQIIDEIPHEARIERYGLDFGYSIDPTVIEAIYYYNGGYIIDEITYQKELSNKSIADIINSHARALVVADSAEPKSIDEIASYGVNIIGATKGAGSVSQGIDFVQQQKISITSRSVRTLKAYRNYLWATDRNGKSLNEPDDRIHEWSNPMDSVRYGFSNLRVTNEFIDPNKYNSEDNTW